MGKPPFVMSKYMSELELHKDAHEYYKAQLAEAKKIIKGMLDCVNNDCRCGYGGVCGQCREVAKKIGITSEGEYPARKEASV